MAEYFDFFFFLYKNNENKKGQIYRVSDALPLHDY